MSVAATTGDTLWSYGVGADIADITVDGDAVYALDARGGVHALAEIAAGCSLSGAAVWGSWHISP
jgi:hypothetical protein